jgi:hypothetical protein
LVYLLYFGLFVERVLPVKGTVFPEFQLFLSIPAVLAGSIITPFTLAALQSYQLNHLLFTCHNLPLPFIKY